MPKPDLPAKRSYRYLGLPTDVKKDLLESLSAVTRPLNLTPGDFDNTPLRASKDKAWEREQATRKAEAEKDVKNLDAEYRVLEYTFPKGEIVEVNFARHREPAYLAQKLDSAVFRGFLEENPEPKKTEPSFKKPEDSKTAAKKKPVPPDPED